MTEHITNLILEIALLNTKIYIKVKNLVKVHVNEIEELRLKQEKKRKDFHMPHSFVRNIFIILYYTTSFKVKIWLNQFGS